MYNKFFTYANKNFNKIVKTDLFFIHASIIR
jgi:hypothetical protein